MRIRLICALCALLLLCPSALGETLLLRSQTVEDEAFMDDTSITSVTITRSLTTLGSRVFSGCTSLQFVWDGGNVKQLGEDCFTGCAPSLLISSTPGSTMTAYALQHNLDLDADTTFRALMIGQTYADTPAYPTLVAPAYDPSNLQAALSTSARAPYVTKLYELTCDEILSAIRVAFARADETDISLFYYSGHGRRDGSLVGIDGPLSAQRLRDVLDEVPGRKIVIVDACYSGMLIGKAGDASEVQAASPAEMTTSFISAFRGGELLGRSGELAVSPYLVMTACSSAEQSYEHRRGYGIFTYGLCRGMGFDLLTDTFFDPPADTNGDGMVSFGEVFDYGRSIAWNIAASAGLEQNAQMYPDQCEWFGLIR